MKVTRKDNVIKVKVEEGDNYSPNLIGKTMLKLTNTGRGWEAKFVSPNRKLYPNKYRFIDYEEMNLLVEASRKIKKGVEID